MKNKFIFNIKEMSEISDEENVKNNSNKINQFKSKSSSYKCQNSSSKNSQITKSLKSQSEENKANENDKSKSKQNLNAIINDLKSEYFSKSFDDSENASNFSAKNTRIHRKNKKNFRKLKSQNVELKKHFGVKSLEEKTEEKKIA